MRGFGHKVINELNKLITLWLRGKVRKELFEEVGAEEEMGEMGRYQRQEVRVDEGIKRG